MMNKPPHDRLRKLLALARDAGHTPEGEQARKRADETLQRLGLEERDLDRVDRIFCRREDPLWKKALLEVVASLVEVELFEVGEADERPGHRKGDLKIEADQTEIERVEYHFRSLCRVVEQITERYARDLYHFGCFHVMGRAHDLMPGCCVVLLAEKLQARKEEEARNRAAAREEDDPVEAPESTKSYDHDMEAFRAAMKEMLEEWARSNSEEAPRNGPVPRRESPYSQLLKWLEFDLLTLPPMSKPLHPVDYSTALTEFLVFRMAIEDRSHGDEGVPMQRWIVVRDPAPDPDPDPASTPEMSRRSRR